jgi:small GTP-binding protein
MTRVAKVIVVGDSGVGKTSLLMRFGSDRFDNTVMPTVNGAAFSKAVRVPDGRDIDLQLWDTAGQEQFAAVSAPYYRDACVAIVCHCAITDPEGPFDLDDALDVWRTSVTKWVGRVHENAGPDCEIVLASTKCDLFPKVSDSAEDQWVVATQDIYPELGVKEHFFTAAQSGRNLPDLFEYCAVLCASAAAPVQQITLGVPNEQDVKEKTCC